MQHGRNRTRERAIGGTVRERPFDEADWVDWDHWRSVEELQDFMNGLGGESCALDSFPGDAPDERDQQGRIVRQIRRHGLEIDW